jgi:hypothetical protein
LDADEARLARTTMDGKTEKTFAESFAGVGLMRIGLEKRK